MRGFACLVALLALAPASQARVQGGSPVALVTDGGDRVVAVALPSGRVLGRVSVPPGAGAVASLGATSAVASARSGAVTLLNGLRVTRIFRGFASPHVVAFAPSGEWLYVTDDAGGTLSVIELARSRIVARLHIGGSAHSMAVDPSGNQLWVALGPAARSVAILDVGDPAHPRATGRLDPAGLVHDLAFSPDGRSVWVTYADRAEVGVFYGPNHRLMRLIPTGEPPQRIAFEPFSAARHAFVTSRDGMLRIVSLRSRRVMRLIPVARGPFALAVGGGLLATLAGGTLTERTDEGRILLRTRVARPARGVAIAVLP